MRSVTVSVLLGDGTWESLALAVSSAVNESVSDRVPAVYVSLGIIESVSETVMSDTESDTVIRCVGDSDNVAESSDTVNVFSLRDSERSTEKESSSDTVIVPVRRLRVTVPALSDSESLTVRIDGDGRLWDSVVVSDSDKAIDHERVMVGGGVRVADLVRAAESVNR